MEPEMKYLNVRDFEMKEMAGDGTFEGVASIYNREDLGGDVILRGAFTKTLNDSSTVPILWQHQSDEVIGSGEVSEERNKIIVRGKLDIENDPVAKKAHGKLKAGLIKGLSIGFSAIKVKYIETEERIVRHIQELKLWEISVVTFPALEAARVTRVKSIDDPQPALAPTQDLTPDPSIRSGAGAEQRAAIEPIEPIVDHSIAAARGHELLAELKKGFYNGI